MAFCWKFVLGTLTVDDRLLTDESEIIKFMLPHQSAADFGCFHAKLRP